MGAVSARAPATLRTRWVRRSEEHTSELQSRQYLVCRLLLEKKQLYRLPYRATLSDPRSVLTSIHHPRVPQPSPPHPTQRIPAALPSRDTLPRPRPVPHPPII